MNKINDKQMNYYFISLISFYSLTAFAQPDILFTKTNHDFGTVANLNYPPAVFQFSNTGDKPLAILMINKPNFIKVSYPTIFIEPGEENKILVYPDLNKTGIFNEKLAVVTNASDISIELSISGEVISVQECFPNPDNRNIRKIVVIDEDTKEHISSVQINMTHNLNKQYQEITNQEGEWTGEMPIGKYNFIFKASGYYSLNEEKFVNRSLPILFFELKKIPPEKPEHIIEITENDPVIENPELLFPESSDELPVNLYAANNVVLLLDVSYSMKSGNKIGLLQESIINLASVLRSIDNVTLITYAGSPSLIFKSVPGNNRELIIKEVSSLAPSGITNGVKGLESAYFIANKQFIEAGNNQIILATDGKFTGGNQQPEEFEKMIRDYAAKGIILSIIGFGVDENAKMFMHGMAELSGGSYIHVTTKDDISDTFINEIKARSLKKK